jgi:hypothetical protein
MFSTPESMFVVLRFYFSASSILNLCAHFFHHVFHISIFLPAKEHENIFSMEQNLFTLRYTIFRQQQQRHLLCIFERKAFTLNLLSFVAKSAKKK